ncbi:hypothetical protein [Robiginitalea sp. SC105]|uniref:hypothetical protein n=1 Tax=Robiginitalea sp. SC105 TaxID=2762332 RepID=UPI00163AAABB|nr:hypothetical protein [Robiginitalea sp. SC105]MBC2838848.1 hypothetical protein [Robiginitalea sp. SC105]
MEVIRKYLDCTVLFMSLLILFQSCTVYQKQSVSLKEAAEADTKTRIVMADCRIVKYKYITYKDQAYFGIRTVKLAPTRRPVSAYNKPTGSAPKEVIAEPLRPDEVNAVNLRNKKASNWLTGILIGVPLISLWVYMITDFASGDWLYD